MDVILNIFKHTFFAVIAVKIYQLIYIFSHNFFNDKYWSYTLIYSPSSEKTVSNFLQLLLIAPAFETTIFVSLVFLILSRWTNNTKVMISFSTVAFALLHFVFMGYYYLGVGLIGGLVFSKLYANYFKINKVNTAFFATVSSHSFANLINMYI